MAGKNYQIKATLKGRDQASSVFARIGRNARRHLGGAFKMVGGIFGKLKNTLTSLPVLGGLLGGALGVGGIISWVKDWAAAGDAIAKTSRAAGVSARFFQELGDVAGHAGVGTEEFATSLTKANVNLGLLRAGGGPLVALLKKVSPALLTTLQGTKSTEEGVTTLLDAMSKLKDPAQRAVLAQAAFGKSGLKMALLAEQGTEAIRAQIKAYRELGGGISDDAIKSTEDFQDAMQRLGVVWGGVKNKFGAAFVQAALPWLNKFTDWFRVNQGNIAAMAESFAVDLVNGIKDVAEALPGIARGFASVASAVGKVVGFVDDVVDGVSIWTNLAEDVGDLLSGRAPGSTRSARESKAAGAWNPEVRQTLPGWTAAREKEWQSAQKMSIDGLLGVGDPKQATRARAAQQAASTGKWEMLDYLTRANDPAKLRDVGAAKLGTEVTVKFENAPKGLRVETKGTAPVKVEVGRRTQGVTP